MIEKYNRKTGEKKLLSTNNISNILVDDPSIVSGSTSLSEVIKKTNDDLQELRGNVKWLYKYGGTGSGGGIGGNISNLSKIVVTNNDVIKTDYYDIIYISNNSIVVNYKIYNPSSNVNFKHSVYLNGINLKKDEFIKANTLKSITLDNLNIDINNSLIISAVDENGFNLQDYRLNITSASISISSMSFLDGNYAIMREYSSNSDIEVNLNIENKIVGTQTELSVKLNSEVKLIKVFSDQKITYNLKILEELTINKTLVIGSAYTIECQCKSIGGAYTIFSNNFVFKVTLTDSTSLVVSAINISEEYVSDDDEALKTYYYGSDINFNYLINSKNHSTYRVAFDITNSDGNSIGSVGILDNDGKILIPDKANITGSTWTEWNKNKLVVKNVYEPFNYSTNNLNNNAFYTGVTYIKIYVISSDGTVGSNSINDPIKIVKCKIVENQYAGFMEEYTTSDSSLYFNMYANNPNFQLDTNHFVVSNYIKESGIISGNNTDIDLYNTNKISSGFIKNLYSDHKHALRISGGAYSKIGIDYFNGGDKDFAKSSNGFTFSVAFKTDIHPSSDNVVFSYATYNYDDSLNLGIEITLEEASIYYLIGTTRESVSINLIQGELNIVDFVYEIVNNGNIPPIPGLIKIYLNGVLNSVKEIDNINNLSFGVNTKGYALLGCKETQPNIFSKHSDVNIYNIRIYKSSLTILDIIKNYIINFADLNRKNGDFDWDLINNIKKKNFLDSTWKCEIWNYQDSTWLSGFDLYTRVQKTAIIPTVLLKETFANSGFKELYNTSYKEDDANDIVKMKFDISMEMKNSGETSSINSFNDMKVALQGTSSLSYASKNLEIYFGNDSYNNPKLFTPKPEWLPENQFTLKADVVDSAHSNNTSIGSFVNNSGLFGNNFAMDFTGNTYRDKVKHTLEGFPIYLFFQFGEDIVFLGIYNFNLGRGSHYNLGLKVLKNYNLRLSGNTYPDIVDKYEEYENPYSDGAYSYEVNTNFDSHITGFQQYDKTIIENILEENFPNPDNTSDYNKRVYELYKLLASFYITTDPPKYYLYDPLLSAHVTGSTLFVSKNSLSHEYFSKNSQDEEGYINWKNANAYFITTLAFGMLDSLGKNLTLRTWNAKNDIYGNPKGQFFTCFYDMDTALGLNNIGNQNIPSTTFIDYWYNTNINGYTIATRIPNGVPEQSDDSNDFVVSYNMMNSRLWEVIRRMGYYPSEITENYETMWGVLRSENGELSSSDNFIEKYYINHTKDIGEIMFNYNYTIKYLKKYKIAGSNVEKFNDVRFLHGNRVNYVRKWLSDRFKYIDSCLNLKGYYKEEKTNFNTVILPFKDSPYIEAYLNARSSQSSNIQDSIINFEVVSNVPIIFIMTIGNEVQRVVLKNNKNVSFQFRSPNANDLTLSWNNTNNISIFKGLKQLTFSNIGLLEMKNLLELDLSNVTSLPNVTSLDVSNLIELRKINLEGLRLNTVPNVGFTIDLRNSKKIKEINIINSHVENLRLPMNLSSDGGSAGVIEKLELSGSIIGVLELSNQPFITSLNFSNCNKLRIVNINSLINLRTITFKDNVNLETINIINCPNLISIECLNIKTLTVFTLDNVSSVKTVNLSGCDNPLLNININGTHNLKTLNLSNVKTTKTPILPNINSNIFNTLENINLTSSNINSFDFGSPNSGNTFNYKGENRYILDLSNFINLRYLNVNSNKSLEFIKFKNDINSGFTLISNMFSGCINLERVFGHIILSGTGVFSGCLKFCINDHKTNPDGTTLSYNGPFEGDIDNRNFNTNITFSTGLTSLDNMFDSTKVSLYDVYYILNKIDSVSGITSLASTFASCKNIYTSTQDPLRRDVFLKCGNIKNFSQLFYACSNMKGPLYSVEHDYNDNVTAYNGVLSPLISVEKDGFNKMFYSTGIEYVDDFIFWKLSENKQLQIEYLQSFLPTSAKFVKDVNNINLSGGTDSTAVLASRIIANLPNLVLIREMFNSIIINFDVKHEYDDVNHTMTSTYCPLFFYNTKLDMISNSFNQITATGSLENLFGGQDVLMNKYTSNFPDKLREIRKSFHVISFYNNRLNYPLRNDMFARIRRTIITIGGQYPNTESADCCFYGDGLIKYAPISNSEDGNLNNIFPYTIFSGCTALKEIPGFFSKMKKVNEIEININLPGNIFRDCVNLNNASYAFYDMYRDGNGEPTIKFRLTSKGFINCKLTHISRMFANNIGLIGHIPYGLFYMAINREENIRGWLDTEQVYNSSYGVITDNGKEILDPNAVIISNTGNTITFKRPLINKTIKSAEGVFSNFICQEFVPYTLDISDISSVPSVSAITYALSKNIIKYNENYNPIKYIYNVDFNATTVDPNDGNYNCHMIIQNPMYDPYVYVWNEWCVDGRNIRDNISGVTSLTENMYINNVNGLPTNFHEVENVYTSSNDNEYPFNNPIFWERNYVLPSDIFLYCENSILTNVNYFMADSYDRERENNPITNTMRGRIPPKIFEPLSNIYNLRGIFRNFYFLVPYKPYINDGGGQFTSGYVIPPNLFKYNINLKDVTEIFAGTSMYTGCYISDETLFNNNKNLSIVDSMFSGVIWSKIYSDFGQIPDNIFSQNTNISSAKVFIGNIMGDAENSNYKTGPIKISSAIFQSGIHTNLTDVRSFMNWCNDTNGTIPAFWNFRNINIDNIANAFNGLDCVKILNLNEGMTFDNNKYRDVAFKYVERCP